MSIVYDRKGPLSGVFGQNRTNRKITMTSADGAQIFAVFDEAMLRTGSRADFVFESLRDAIWDGRIGRGMRVREEEIARNMGVSRTPVREALQRLQQRGLLVVGAGRGLVVAELRHDQVVELY